MNSLRRRALALTLLAVLVALAASPRAAEAHGGPTAPVASSYLAKVGRVPAGVQATVVDGDLRMWLRVAARETVVVLDYRGAPYLRFSGAGVEVNQNSAMYYLNQTPVAAIPPANLSPTAPPRWQRVTAAHEYTWHDGRLHALATLALSPGVAYVGRWSIPALVDGRLSSISGGLWHAPPPSIVWFWPIVVMLLCLLAARRLRRPSLDARLARVVAVAALTATAATGVAQELHGRPAVSVFQLIALGAILAFVGWGLFRVLFRPFGFVSFLVIAFAAVYQGSQTIPVLLNGFVLMAVPASAARTATVLCLGCGLGLLLLSFRLEQGRKSSSWRRRTQAGPLDGEEDSVAESLV
jgi:hypothetical protein